MSEGELVFVGLGLHDERGVTVVGLEESKNADVVFAEFYTSALSEGSLQRLSASTGKRIELLDRAQVESGEHILDLATSKKVVLLVAGDPMTATTHVELRLRAVAKGIRTRVVNGVSALTAVPGLLGLQHYKFGRAVSLPIYKEGYSPTSPYDQIVGNLTRGLHTLVLLDIDAENNKYMTANDGLRLLTDISRRVANPAITTETLGCVVARAGSPDCVVRAGRIGDLAGIDFGKPMHSIVVPGKLHFMELEALKALAGLDGDWTPSN